MSTATPGPLRITGRLLRPAESRCTTGALPRALVQVELSTGAGLPYTALLDLGSGFAAHLAAANKAKRLHTGTRCTVSCQGLRLRQDHSTAALLCLGVDGITEATAPHHVTETERHQPHEAQHAA